jgi:hypothetical protein
MADSTDKDWNRITLEIRGDTLLIDGKSCKAFHDFAEQFIEDNNFRVPEGIIMLAEFMASQAAMHDHNNGDQYFLEMGGEMFARFYVAARAQLLLVAASTPPKDQLN